MAVYVSSGRINAVRKLISQVEPDESKVDIIMDMVKQGLDYDDEKYKRQLDDRREKERQIRTKMKDEGVSTYTDARRLYYIENKAHLNKNRTRRLRQVREAEKEKEKENPQN
jgi:hypothetical protein